MRTTRARWAIVPGLAIVLASALASCTQTRRDVANAVGFVKQANALSRQPDTTGPFPSPFAADARTPSETVLSPEERQAAYAELQRVGAVSRQETLAREARLRELSPY